MIKREWFKRQIEIIAQAVGAMLGLDVAHDRDDAKDGLRGAFVNAFEGRSIAWRPNHPAMHHTSRAHILNEDRAASDLRWNIMAGNRLPDDTVRSDRLGRNLGAGFTLEIGFGCKLGVADFSAVRRGNFAVLDF